MTVLNRFISRTNLNSLHKMTQLSKQEEQELKEQYNLIFAHAHKDEIFSFWIAYVRQREQKLIERIRGEIKNMSTIETVTSEIIGDLLFKTNHTVVEIKGILSLPSLTLNKDNQEKL